MPVYIEIGVKKKVSNKGNWRGLPAITGVNSWGCWNPGELMLKSSREKLAIEIRQEISSNSPDQIKNHPKAALQNLGIDKFCPFEASKLVSTKTLLQRQHCCRQGQRGTSENGISN